MPGPVPGLGRGRIGKSPRTGPSLARRLAGIGLYRCLMLVGRERECALVDRLLERARAEVAGVAVVLGEAGIGKTALLDYAAGRAEGMTVVRAVGVESEAQLEFSGLFDVCRPLLDH